MTKTIRSVLTRTLALGTLVAFVGACASTTMIHSNPQGAKLYLNGEPVGRTPYAMTDTKIVGSTTIVRLEMEGYEPTHGTIARNEQFSVGACIGGVFLLFPFLWIMEYKPLHTFELQPAANQTARAPGDVWAAPPPGQARRANQ